MRKVKLPEKLNIDLEKPWKFAKKIKLSYFIPSKAKYRIQVFYLNVLTIPIAIHNTPLFSF